MQEPPPFPGRPPPRRPPAAVEAAPARPTSGQRGRAPPEPRAPPAGLELPSSAVSGPPSRRPGDRAASAADDRYRASVGPPALEASGGSQRRAFSANSSVAALMGLGLSSVPEESSSAVAAHLLREGTPSPAFPVLSNVAAYTGPKAYAAAVRGTPLMQQPCRPPVAPSAPRQPKYSPIDEAVRREAFGSGMALDQAVASRQKAGWAVNQRHVQKSDVGHCCHACRQPLRDLGQEVTVWTGAAIYRRFHPACAATFVLRADGERQQQGGGGGGGGGARGSDQGGGAPENVVESYADGWRALRDRPTATNAARDWLLSQDPNAWNDLRGDLFTTVTVIENGKKKAVPGLSHEQLRTLQTRCRWTPAHLRAPCGPGCGDAADEEPDECAICFGAPEDAPCIRLPCAPQHVFHVGCVTPWLKKASLCPTCRRDIRPLLPPARGVSR